MKRNLVVMLVAGALTFGAQAFAHHSFAATYLEDQEMSIEGDLVHSLDRIPLLRCTFKSRVQVPLYTNFTALTGS